MNSPIWTGLWITSLAFIIFLMLKGLGWMLGVIPDMSWAEYGFAFAIFITLFVYSQHKINQENVSKDNSTTKEEK